MQPKWQQILRTNFTSWEKLARFLELSSPQQEKILKHSRFPLNLPLRLAKKIAKNTLQDPILKQFLPTKEEQKIAAGFVQDPVQDASFRKGRKLLQKYSGRALLICTSACAMHCRYCFRQNFDYETENKSFEDEINALKADQTIREVILSGGDPLSLNDRILGSLLKELSSIPQITRVRFHTRFPIGIPERIDDGFLTILQGLPFQVWFVIHCNHPRELDEDILWRLNALQRLGIPILNQAVLLKGINDNKNVLKQLCETLADHGILSYYLHQLDRVQGASHFEVSQKKGKKFIQTITQELPGYAIPKYVAEIAGNPSKTLLR